MTPTDATAPRPARLLVVAPSWVGDAAMATPAMRALREALPGAFVGALMRPGIDQVLAGADLFDEAHVDRAHGVMGPKRVAQKLRRRRYDAAVVFPGSFSTALITRLAWIRQRVGYERDARAPLLTHTLRPPRRRDTPPFDRDPDRGGELAPVPACEYYARLAGLALRTWGLQPPMDPGPLRLAATDGDAHAAEEVLARDGLSLDQLSRRGAIVLNPGANNPAKRWPPERFARVGADLADERGWTILVNGAPSERELADHVVSLLAPRAHAVSLAARGVTIAALKPILAASRLLLTNDTGPRHLAAALGCPAVALFGPTDHRWTTIPFERERRLLADPTLPDHLVADDHPERCDIARITTDAVLHAAHDLLG
jgi:heptosyltransferase-2